MAKRRSQPFEEPVFDVPPTMRSKIDQRKVRFGRVYDVGFFNLMVASYTGLETTMIPCADAERKYRGMQKDMIPFNTLWKMFGEENRRARDQMAVSEDFPSILMSKALRLLPRLSRHLPLNIRTQVAVHFRIEDDWHYYCTVKAAEGSSLRFYTAEEICETIPEAFRSSSFYFVCGSKHQEVETALSTIGCSDAEYYYDRTLTYTENAAISLEACMRARVFIGNSYSSFSNFATGWRQLCGMKDTFIYNGGSSIRRARDFGLFCSPQQVVNAVSYKR